MFTAPLDLDDLIAADEDSPLELAARGVDIGHVHLKVADTDAAAEFWTETMGMDLMQRFGADAVFCGQDGYHHHVGANSWASRGAALEPAEGPGLARIAGARGRGRRRRRHARRDPGRGDRTDCRGVSEFRHRLRVRYSECDPQNVVFNARYLEYFDIGMTELWRETIGPYEPAMQDHGVDMVVAEATIRYLSSLRFDEEFDLVMTIKHMGTTSLSPSIAIESVDGHRRRRGRDAARLRPCRDGREDADPGPGARGARPLRRRLAPAGPGARRREHRGADRSGVVAEGGRHDLAAQVEQRQELARGRR